MTRQKWCNIQQKAIESKLPIIEHDKGLSLDKVSTVETVVLLSRMSGICIGSVTDLKYAVNKGVPVIVLIRENTSESYLHYVPVVGYDKDYIYVADSLRYMINADGPHYNRQISIEEFKTLWKTDTFVVNNIYITIKK